MPSGRPAAAPRVCGKQDECVSWLRRPAISSDALTQASSSDLASGSASLRGDHRQLLERPPEVRAGGHDERDVAGLTNPASSRLACQSSSVKLAAILPSAASSASPQPSAPSLMPTSFLLGGAGRNGECTRPRDRGTSPPQPRPRQPSCSSRSCLTRCSAQPGESATLCSRTGRRGNRARRKPPRRVFIEAIGALRAAVAAHGKRGGHRKSLR